MGSSLQSISNRFQVTPPINCCQLEFQLLHIGGGANRPCMNGIHFGIPNARRSRGLHVVDSYGPLTELALLRRYTDGLGWSIIRSSQVCKVYGTAKAKWCLYCWAGFAVNCLPKVTMAVSKVPSNCCFVTIVSSLAATKFAIKVYSSYLSTSIFAPNQHLLSAVSDRRIVLTLKSTYSVRV